MRLIKCGTSASTKKLELELCDDMSPDETSYVILSHRWGPAKDEVSYQDFKNGLAEEKAGYLKIQKCCLKARINGYSYVWIDTCCIDKTSSAELSEAINSMYTWYMKSAVCYAYLSDVDEESANKFLVNFRSSRWFTRGWTLQELIAPKEVIFFDYDWKFMGRKSRMADLLADVTKIDTGVLEDPKSYLPEICTSQILYWASKRQTTRIEDRAYSLIGLFNISLPIIYGEGDRAFRRLQEEIMRLSFDHTIFAWHLTKPCSGLLAGSPDAFAKSGKVKPLPLNIYSTFFQNPKPHKLDYSMKTQGLKIQLPLLKIPNHLGLYYAFIACSFGSTEVPIHLYLRESVEGTADQFFRTRRSSESFNNFNLKWKTKWLPEIRELAELRTIWILQSRVNLEKMVRPLPRNCIGEKYADPRVSPGPGIIETNVIHMMVRTKGSGLKSVGSTYPLPSIANYDSDNDTNLVIETEVVTVWITSLTFRYIPRKLMVLLVVVDDALIVHFEAVKDTDLTSLNFVRSCEAFYEKCKQSSSPPCSLIRVQVKIDNLNPYSDIVEASVENNFRSKNGPGYARNTQSRYNVRVHSKRVSNDSQELLNDIEKKMKAGKNGKSLKELLAKTKHISAHLHEKNYKD